MTKLPKGADHQIQEHLTIEGDPPVAILSDEATARVIYNDCTSEQAALAVSKRRPQPVARWTTPVEIDDAMLASMRRWCVLSSRDQAMAPLALMRRMIR